MVSVEPKDTTEPKIRKEYYLEQVRKTLEILPNSKAGDLLLRVHAYSWWDLGDARVHALADLSQEGQERSSL